jgi:hypothetical protein
MHMTEEELSKLVESKLADRLAARLAADRERVRQEVILELRREAERAHYDAIDQRWREREARERAAEPERRRIMAEGVRRDMESMDRSNAKVVEGSLAAMRAADRAGGSAGFKIR